MSPFQPRHDRAADRDDRARRQADDNAQQLLGRKVDAHHRALQHIAECVECRARLFTLALEANAMVQLEREFERLD